MCEDSQSTEPGPGEDSRGPGVSPRLGAPGFGSPASKPADKANAKAKGKAKGKSEQTPKSKDNESAEKTKPNPITAADANLTKNGVPRNQENRILMFLRNKQVAKKAIMYTL